ncbi:hypothetical protein HPB52_016389 [Rhipicephalus sanguineus]|uniref:Cuticle protein n=1 Tax=Rhipicephalus sanguineus TaxID=34632 RepID=A0A9D4Q155_RHISA|nr:hypothetical protein HPB52_016389 [Rhipicephalus sanguineus]
MLLEPSQPYSFGYDNVDAFGYRQFRSEQGDSNNAKTSSYGYRDMSGLYRRVNYVADAYGFHATVDTNEPGTAPGASAGVVFNAAPVVQPFSSGGAQSGARTGFAATAVAPYNVGATMVMADANTILLVLQERIGKGKDVLLSSFDW